MLTEQPVTALINYYYHLLKIVTEQAVAVVHNISSIETNKI